MRSEEDAVGTMTINITDIEVAAASRADVEEGLLGYVTCTINGALRIERLVLRRTATGRLTLSFPARRTERGRQQFYLRPVSDAARREIEAQIFAAIGAAEEANP